MAENPLLDYVRQLQSTRAYAAMPFIQPEEQAAQEAAEADAVFDQQLQNNVQQMPIRKSDIERIKNMLKGVRSIKLWF